MNPTLQDLYQFLMKMHGNEEAAKADFDYFVAGKLPEHLIEYCRQAVAVESVNKEELATIARNVEEA